MLVRRANKYPPVAKLDIAVDSDSKGRGFESLRAGQKQELTRQRGLLFLFQTGGMRNAMLATAAGGGNREQGLAPRSTSGKAACPPQPMSGTARVAPNSASGSEQGVWEKAPVEPSSSERRIPPGGPKTRAHASICTISGKMRLATTVFSWWLFDTQKAKKSPARGGAKIRQSIRHIWDSCVSHLKCPA